MLRAELVILDVDTVAHTVRERFVVELPLKPSIATGYDVGIDRLNAPLLHTAIRNGRLLVTFEGVYQGSFPAVSLFDVKIR